MKIWEAVVVFIRNGCKETLASEKLKKKTKFASVIQVFSIWLDTFLFKILKREEKAQKGQECLAKHEVRKSHWSVKKLIT